MVCFKTVLLGTCKAAAYLPASRLHAAAVPGVALAHGNLLM
jgi:hypothetical protein